MGFFERKAGVNILKYVFRKLLKAVFTLFSANISSHDSYLIWY